MVMIDKGIDKAFAEQFAAEWIAAWNSHDLERVLAHYTDDFEMSSPLIRQIVSEPSGKLKGKPAVRAYWAKGLAAIPDLRLELTEILIGAESVTLIYKGHRGLSAEVFVFDDAGKVKTAMAHYEP